MINVRAFFFLIIVSLIGLSGCTAIVSATSDGPIKEDPGERTLGAAIDDQIIETKALVNIRAAHKDLDNANVDAVSYNGILLLIGQVPSENLRQLAAKTAADIKRVRRVHNELAVTGKTSLLVRSNDAWLSTKVRSKLAFSDKIESGRIKVVTENGVVYLMGIVNAQEADIAADLVRQTNGVQRVVRVFEYI
ncbi:MAG: phospholipid-binding protein [Spongiibacteraceae bacterium]|jgi:osmotically-inducible protein OsmY|nr:phospholipid-binding protein [Spongiibacteraceae bacterium]